MTEQMQEEMAQEEIKIKADGSEELPKADYEIYPIIEAILFAAGYPLPYEKICGVLGFDEKEDIERVKSLVSDLSEGYEKGGGGLRILMYDDSCQMCTSELYGTYVREALGIRQGGRLSPSSLEVLAIIAYSQPITKLQIERIRGVDSQYAVASLCAKNLIEPKGRLDMPGRPILYGTTEDFLRCFGINSLSELEKVEEFTDTAQVTLEESAQEENAST